MKFSVKEKEVLYAYACLDYHNTVTRLKWLTALAVDPEAKRWMLELARKIDALIEKYTTGEMAEVHEALVARCRAGDVSAIRLYNELQQEDKTDETASNNLLEAILASTGGKR